MAKKKKKRPMEKKRGFKPENHDFPDDIKLVKPDDEFSFQCSYCGECCRDVKESIMLESLDVFRISQYFKRIGNPIQAIEDILAEYTTPMPLTDLGYPIFLINTTGQRNECVFLKSGRCSIHPVKPRPCRLYPLSAGPSDKEDDFSYYIVSQKQHHFTGPKHRVGEWMNKYFSKEDREFTAMEYKTAPEFGRLLRKLKEKGKDGRRILYPIFLYKYFDFDTDAPFMPQYIQNIEKLKKTLADIANG